MSLLAPSRPAEARLTPIERFRVRDRLQDLWRAHVGEITELAVRFHSGDPDGGGGSAELAARLVQARARLADIEDAMRRLDSDTYGVCQECGADIGTDELLVRPEQRRCPVCRSRESGARPTLGVCGAVHLSGRSRCYRAAGHDGPCVWSENFQLCHD